MDDYALQLCSCTVIQLIMELIGVISRCTVLFLGQNNKRRNSASANHEGDKWHPG